MKDEVKSGIVSIPGYFYDAIVYYSSFFLLLSIYSYLFIDYNNLKNITNNLSIFEGVLICTSTLALGYVWGQLSSALSYHVVKRPVTLLVKKIKPRDMNDFLFSFDKITATLDEKKILNGKEHRNYWTIIYYLYILYPSIGSDVIKRYARCKLARVNAFNFIVLIIIGIIFYVSNMPIYHIQWPFLFIIFLIFTILFYFEFYQRQCWFGDLVIKILSAVLTVEEKAK